MASKDTVDIPHSKVKSEIARILKREGYITDYTTEGQGGKRVLRLYLKYQAPQKPVIQGLRRISKPGLRRYANSGKIPRVLNGMGTVVLSTSSGIMTGDEARKQNVGGEVLCYVW
jgi:small subunit ribosomal protein S8